MTLTRDVQMEFTTGTWTSVFSDIRSADGLTASWGSLGYGPTERVASPGTLSFLLDNSQANSNGTLGYYAPDHASVRSGFGIGTPVRVIVSNGTITDIKKYYISSITPVPGKYLSRATEIAAVDYIGKMGDQYAAGLTVQTTKRVDEALDTLIATAPIPPEVEDFATGIDTLAYLFHDIDSRKMTITAAAQRLLQSDLGYLSADAGTINFSSTDITDATGKTWTLASGAKIDTSPKFGYGALTTSDAATPIESTDSADWYFDGDFSIDTWAKLGSVPASSDAQVVIASNYEDATHQVLFCLTQDSGVERMWFYAIGGSGTIDLAAVSSDLVFSSDSYNHYEICRSGNDFHFFFNGVLIGTTDSSDTLPDVAGPWRIGAGITPGFFDEYRISKGIARHTAGFTPQTKPYTVDAYTMALLHFDQGSGEVLKYQTRHTRLFKDSIVTLDDTMNGLEIVHADKDIFNNVSVISYPVELGSSDTSDAEVLYQLQRELELPPGVAQEYTFRYRDPDTQSNAIRLLPGSEITPTSDEYRVSSIAGDGGNDLTTDVALTIEWFADYACVSALNNNVSTGYWNFLQLKGRIIRLYDPAEVSRVDTSGNLALYGDRPLRFALPYQDNPNTGDDFADYLLNRWKTPATNINLVEFVADKSTTLETAMLSGLIGEKVTITETATGLSAIEYYINGVEWVFEPTLTRCRWYLERASGSDFWILGEAGMSELGETTILGF